MRKLLCVFTMGSLLSLSAFAQEQAHSSTQKTETSASVQARKAPLSQEVKERRLVAYVSSAVTVAALAGGITMGVLAQQQFSCLEDVVACNASADEKIEGGDFVDAVTEVEHKSLIADMLFLASAAAGIVAVTSVLQGFVFTGEEEEEAEAAEASAMLIPVLPAFALGGAP